MANIQKDTETALKYIGWLADVAITAEQARIEAEQQAAEAQAQMEPLQAQLTQAAEVEQIITGGTAV